VLRFGLCVASVLGLASVGRAADGRVEVNQSAVLAAGGFPFRILSPGSYLLTGDLSVPLGVTAIQIGANDVTLDLNGFAIRGPHACGSGGCSAGSTIGIEALPVMSELARDTTVRNGTVAGFGGNCLDLGAGARVERLVVRRCGGSGIRAAEHAQAVGNRVSDCGGFGLSFLAAASYGGNLLAAVNRLGAAGFTSGGTSSGGNLCDGIRCTAERRRYYLTPNQLQGNHGANDCAFGFHMASIFELLDLSDLEYDRTRGYLLNDIGSGPPEAQGWARPGTNGGATTSCSTGQINSPPWSSNSATSDGVVVTPIWGSFATSTDSTPRWRSQVMQCDDAFRVWCVED
jgi:hypothetical protein